MRFASVKYPSYSLPTFFHGEIPIQFKYNICGFAIIYVFNLFTYICYIHRDKMSRMECKLGSKSFARVYMIIGSKCSG